MARRLAAKGATEVLLAPSGHAGRTDTLTGPEALSFREIAAILGEGTGREVTYLDETPTGHPATPLRCVVRSMDDRREPQPTIVTRSVRSVLGSTSGPGSLT